jgi:hypothetical protein
MVVKATSIQPTATKGKLGTHILCHDRMRQKFRHSTNLKAILRVEGL